MSNDTNLVAQVTLANIRTLAEELKSGMQLGLYKDANNQALTDLQEVRLGLNAFADKIEYQFKKSGFMHEDSGT